MTTPPVSLIVLAKSPCPGRVKTRLCPPCTPEEAATLAAAALADTLAAAAATPAARHVLALDGEPGSWPRGPFEVIPQRDGGLAARLDGAFAAVGGPALLVGMDTPQLTPALLATSIARLREPSVDAVLGFADDGGYWAIGLTEPGPVFDGVPMSTDETGRLQLERLHALGRRVAVLPRLRDVDHYADAAAVAASAPDGAFARAFATIDARYALA